MQKSILNRLEIYKGDITTLQVDAIVNAANTSLLGGGGVDGAIHRAAGSELLEECRTIGGCPTGEARITKGYNLPSRYVIHTVGPVYHSSKNPAQLLASCYTNSLSLAHTYGIKTIAFPAISCGVYGYPIKDACTIAIQTSIQFLTDRDDIEKVMFVLFSEADMTVYKRYMDALRITD
ncbi:MAG: O-acetyl-ADP-ribose deacetylase [Desulfobacterales bacterium]|nr:O-acetyl-ADP-ribose deacetylase [Desulfobacterales bacterium]